LCLRVLRDGRGTLGAAQTRQGAALHLPRNLRFLGFSLLLPRWDLVLRFFCLSDYTFLLLFWQLGGVFRQNFTTFGTKSRDFILNLPLYSGIIGNGEVFLQEMTFPWKLPLLCT